MNNPRVNSMSAIVLILVGVLLQQLDGWNIVGLILIVIGIVLVGVSLAMTRGRK